MKVSSLIKMSFCSGLKFLSHRSLLSRNLVTSILRCPGKQMHHFTKDSKTLIGSKFLNCVRINRLTIIRHIQRKTKKSQEKDVQTMLLYMSSLGIVMLGVSFAGVPLYRIFCQQMGLGGIYIQDFDVKKVGTMKPVEDRVIKVRFEADASSRLQWNFRPLQSEVNVMPGETALAFFTARNSTEKPVVGISTYNIMPYEAGPYFNKIQCFCFEDQLLNPREQVDLPVFFYIDPEFADDPSLAEVNEILLSYIFYPSKQGFEVPTPNFLQPKNATVIG